MSLCLNDCRTRLPVRSSLDPSSEIDLIGSYQAERERFSLGFRRGALYWCSNGSAVLPGERHMGNPMNRSLSRAAGKTWDWRPTLLFGLVAWTAA